MHQSIKRVRTSPLRISRALCTASDASFIELEFRPGELFPLDPLAARLNVGGVCICSLFADTHCCFTAGMRRGGGGGVWRVACLSHASVLRILSMMGVSACPFRLRALDGWRRRGGAIEGSRQHRRRQKDKQNNPVPEAGVLPRAVAPRTVHPSQQWYTSQKQQQPSSKQ